MLFGSIEPRGLGRRDESPFMAEMTIQDPDMRECAILLRVRDRSLHAYIQQYPFCTGPDKRSIRNASPLFASSWKFASQRFRGLSNR